MRVAGGSGMAGSRSVGILAACFGVLAPLLGCSAEVVVPGGGVDHDPPPPVAGSSGSTGSGSHPTPPIGDVPAACQTFDATGLGTTWTESMALSGSLRPLRCLARGTPEISGRFIANAFETNLPDLSGSSVAENDRVYDYA